MGKHYVMFTIEDSKTLKHRKDLMGKRKEVQDLYSGLNLFKKLAVSPWITWFILSSEKSSCCQTWANSQDDNYFPISKWWKVVILTISFLTCSDLARVIFLSAWDKSRDLIAHNQLLEEMLTIFEWTCSIGFNFQLF